MYAGLKITPPFFEIGPKAYLYGKEVLILAQHADNISRKYDVQIIFTPQYVDIPILACETENILVFAQHMDSLKVGRGVGSVLPEAVKAAGAVGVLLNHVEKRLSMDELERTIKRADEVELATMVCADNLEDAAAIARMEPNIIIAESPELIGVGKRDMNDQLAIAKINHIIWEINPEIRVLHGAGISCGQDVYDIVASGAQGAGSTSGIIKANDPFGMLEEMIRCVREAWDKTENSEV
ncbi:MAG: triose-phosphate isomerase [Anaerolineales bacterium]|nr:triose-phosphate isomerase [Anaerolineales bacterium]